MSWTSNQIINRVPNRLSARKRSSGSEANIAKHGHDGYVDDRDLLDALYILGHMHGVRRIGLLRNTVQNHKSQAGGTSE